MFDYTGLEQNAAVDECCCDDILFDGTCLGEEEVIIAHCSKVLNFTYAECTWAKNNEAVQCFRGDCYEKRRDPLISFLVPMITGFVFLFGAITYNCCTMAKGESAAWRRKYKLIQPRGSTRIFQELGISLIILGFALEFYEESFTVAYIIAVIPSALTLMFIIMYAFCSDHKEILEDEEEVEVVNLYQDFSASVPRLYVTFLSQFCLLSVYLYQVDHGEEPNFSNIDCYFYYVLGALVQVGYNKAKSDEREGYLHYWLTCFVKIENRGFVPKLRILGRWFCSFLINNLGCDVIIILLPMHLTQSGSPMDFVLNAVAAYFITEIDDLNDTRVITSWQNEFDKLEWWKPKDKSDEEEKLIPKNEDEKEKTYDPQLIDGIEAQMASTLEASEGHETQISEQVGELE